MFVARKGQERLFQLGIAPEPLRAANQPHVELVLDRPQLALQLGRIAFGVIHQVARVHLEEFGQDLPGFIRQMRPRPAFNL